MKVKLATQVLSHTVSAAMLMSISLGTLPPSTAGTAEIISTFAQHFDCLNNSSLKASKSYRRPMLNNSPHAK